MAKVLFTRINNAADSRGSGTYGFTFEGTAYTSQHLVNGTEPLSESFELDIEPDDTNVLAHVGADRTFWDGVTLASGRFARSQRFAAYQVQAQSATDLLRGGEIIGDAL